MKQPLVFLALMAVALSVGATGGDDCRKSLAMLDAAMQLEDVQLGPEEGLDAVVSECQASWPRYRGYINCAKRAKGHDDLIACIDLWQRRLRRQRGMTAAVDGGDSRKQDAGPGVGAAMPVAGGRLQLSLSVTPNGVCWYDNRLFSVGAVLLMPADGRPYRCGVRKRDRIMGWMPGTKP
jgi:hypothetical protein